MCTSSCHVIKRGLAVAGFLVLTSCGGGVGTSGPCALMSCGGPPSNITVFAAASLQPAFDKIAVRVKSQYYLATTFNYAGTQTLTTQLIQGAQADVFASADTVHMTTVQNGGLVGGDTRVFAHNKLEIAVERGNPKRIRSLADLARSGLVVVLADPSVPAGKYAQEALANAHVTVHPASLEPQVTGVLSKVAFGEADAGIVYVSDIVTSGKVDGIAIPDTQNVIADYSIARLNSAWNRAGADEFFAYVLSSQGQAILSGAGFDTV
ncbi:MAG: molybdate ABC transporter substrate-binding protein [Chloroflexi bacterium]|nr:MAG: molybdate ABC transporter substrate-binding protein [Chloroflexota bacterium]TME37020.1 MAG: molybdate ABC transporter substrate-binding protein [Chloroflexota bacterium]